VYFARGVDAVQQRHPDVQDGNRRLQGVTHLDRRVPVGSLADDVKAFLVKNGLEALTQNGLVVCKQYS
jgi:hypothetical protein